jgi:hypothetical protein
MYIESNMSLKLFGIKSNFKLNYLAILWKTANRLCNSIPLSLPNKGCLMVNCVEKWEILMLLKRKIYEIFFSRLILCTTFFTLGFSYIIQLVSLRPLLDQSNQMVRQTGHYSCLIGFTIPQVCEKQPIDYVIVFRLACQTKVAWW